MHMCVGVRGKQLSGLAPKVDAPTLGVSRVRTHEPTRCSTPPGWARIQLLLLIMPSKGHYDPVWNAVLRVCVGGGVGQQRALRPPLAHKTQVRAQRVRA